TPRKNILPAHRIWEVLSHRTQFPHGISGRFYKYSPVPPQHTETAAPSPPATSHNTVPPHNASYSRRSISSLSVCTAGYHGAPHLPRKYNEHHWWLPDQFPSPDAYAEAADLLSAAPVFHDPEVRERNFPFQKFPHSKAPPFFLPRTFPWSDIWPPHLPDRH